MRSDTKRDIVTIQNLLLEQVKTLTLILESERLTAIGRRELMSSLRDASIRIERLPFVTRT